jgi:RNA polymerase sigma-70 factor (ECF subfamily)
VHDSTLAIVRGAILAENPAMGGRGRFRAREAGLSRGLSSDTIRAAQQGDAVAIEALLQALHPLFLRTMRLELPGEEADDVVQEGLLRVCAALRGCDATRPFLPWALCLLKRARVDWERRMQRHRHQPLHAPQADGDTDGTASEDLADPAPSPFQVVDDRLTREVLAALVGRLPADERQVLSLRCFRGLPLREVAELMGISIQKVRRTCARARRRLLTLGEELPGGEPWSL